jgi:hypothetical protein
MLRFGVVGVFARFGDHDSVGSFPCGGKIEVIHAIIEDVSQSLEGGVG